LDEIVTTPIVVNPRGRETGWRKSLVLQLQELGRWLEGRFVVEPRAGDQIIPAENYLDLDFLRAAIEAVKTTNLAATYRAPDGFDMGGGDDHDIDVRIATSRFTRQYCSSLSITALTALACGVGLDLSIRRCRLVLRNNIPFYAHLDVDESAILRCRERPTRWPISDGPVVDSLAELRTHVWRKLYAENVVPVFERAHQLTKVAPRLLWSNCAEWPGMVSDAAEEYLDSGRARAYVEDRIAVLQADALPGVAGRNPMRGLIDWLPTDAPDFTSGVQTRKVCCLTYMLPDRLGRICQNCSLLSVEDRVALIRERHGVPMGSPGGPAERRAIEVGLTKLGYSN
jgi:ferric iron reductase FhuF-like transporter